MAVLTGFFDGTVVAVRPILIKAGVDTFLAVTNNGPNTLHVQVGTLTAALEPANSHAFFVPSGTTVDINAPLSTASLSRLWEWTSPCSKASA